MTSRAPSISLCALAIFLIASAPLEAHATGDLHDLYDAVLGKGRAVTIPAPTLARLKLGSPAGDIPAREITVTEKNQDQRGITAFEIAGVPTMTMFHTEADKDDSWLLSFSLDGRIRNQEWEEGGYRTYQIRSPQIAAREIAFWRHWMRDNAKSGAPATAGGPRK